MKLVVFEQFLPYTTGIPINNVAFRELVTISLFTEQIYWTTAKNTLIYTLQYQRDQGPGSLRATLRDITYDADD